jgi:hypothetical protein
LPRRRDPAVSCPPASGTFSQQVQVIEKGAGAGGKPATDPPRLPLDVLPADWREERLLDDPGEKIFIRHKGDPKGDPLKVAI